MLALSHRYQFTPTKEEIKETLSLMNDNLKIPTNFTPTAESYDDSRGKPRMDMVHMPQPKLNPQTVTFCDTLGLDDPVALLLGAKRKAQTSPRTTPVSSQINESESNITMDTSKLSNSPEDVRNL